MEREAQRGARRAARRPARSSGLPHGPEALGQARRPSAGPRTSARAGRRSEMTRPRGGEQLAQRGARQQARVGGDEAPPAPAGDARGQRRRVGRDHAQHAAGAQQPRAAIDRGDRVVEVLDHVGEHDDVEAVEIDEGLDRLPRARRAPAPRGRAAPPSARARGRRPRSRARAPRRAAAHARSRRRAGARRRPARR